MTSFPLVSSHEQLVLVKTDLARSLNTSMRLPDSPFKNPMRSYSFCEFEVFRGGDFGKALHALAESHGDEFVSGASIDPNIESYYLPEYRSFASFRHSVSTVSQTYFEALVYEPGGSNAGELYSTVRVLAVGGSSGSWSVWGEHELGVAIVATDDPDTDWRPEGMVFLSAEEALYSFVEPNFNRQPMSDKFRRTFLQNFVSPQTTSKTPDKPPGKPSSAPD